MMTLGIFAKTFQRDQVQAVCRAVIEHRFTTAQFNMSCAGLPSMPDDIPKATIEEIQAARETTGLTFSGLSATYNMCHPDPLARISGLARLETLAQHSKAIGTDLLTLCTGTRDPYDKWKFHPDNHSRESWRDMIDAMEKAILIAEKYDLHLGIEPELANVVSSPAKAKQLLDELSSDRLKIILDPANLFERAGVGEIKRLIDQAIDLLGPRIIMAHAKDRNAKGDFVVPGRGIIPFAYFIRQLRAADIEVPLVAHGFSEEDATAVRQFLGKESGSLL